MNNENKPSVIAELAAALASMAERAAAAEAEAEQYKKSSGEWYQFFTSKDKELRDTQAELQKASDNEDMIQTTEKPKWGEFKKRLEIVGGQIVDKTTGELVEGVQIIEKPDTFTVDV